MIWIERKNSFRWNKLIFVSSTTAPDPPKKYISSYFWKSILPPTPTPACDLSCWWGSGWLVGSRFHIVHSNPHLLGESLSRRSQANAMEEIVPPSGATRWSGCTVQSPPVAPWLPSMMMERATLCWASSPGYISRTISFTLAWSSCDFIILNQRTIKRYYRIHT